jgi:hypothetical protein
MFMALCMPTPLKTIKQCVIRNSLTQITGWTIGMTLRPFAGRAMHPLQFCMAGSKDDPASICRQYGVSSTPLHILRDRW